MTTDARWWVRRFRQVFPFVLLVSVAWMLKYFWALIFLTFVLGSFMGGLVRFLQRRTGWHRVSCLILSYMLLISIFSIMIARVIPLATREGAEIWQVYMPRAVKSYQDFIQDNTEAHGDLITWAGKSVDAFLKDHTPSVLRNATVLVGSVFRALLFIILSIVFSFLVLLDPVEISTGVDKLRYTRAGWIYEALVPHVTEFFAILGKVFDAQIVIALLNTLLTAVGLMLFGINNALFLSLMVFICGLIPVLGVFISSTPILLVALLQEGGGILLAIKALSMILGVHALEAYVLNPRIMGDHLKIHPFTVLLTLLIGEHFLGLWGVLLGVPIITYISYRVNEAAAAHIALNPGDELRALGEEPLEVRHVEGETWG